MNTGVEDGRGFESAGRRGGLTAGRTQGGQLPRTGAVPAGAISNELRSRDQAWDTGVEDGRGIEFAGRRGGLTAGRTQGGQLPRTGAVPAGAITDELRSRDQGC